MNAEKKKKKTVPFKNEMRTNLILNKKEVVTPPSKIP